MKENIDDQDTNATNINQHTNKAKYHKQVMAT